MTVSEKMRLLAEEKYKDFSASLIPTVNKNTVLGVRVPHLRKLAKSLTAAETEHFLSDLPHTYHEENILHALLIGNIKDTAQCLAMIERFLPCIDNWAVCDSLRPKCFAKDPTLLLTHIEKWILSEHSYTVRFGIEMLMLHFLGDTFRPSYPEAVANVNADEYYVGMMVAWFFATALTVRYEEILPYIETGRLSPWIQNKAIQKATESLRIPEEHKKYLKSLRRGRKENL